METDWAPEEIDPTIPSAARMYDYALGGVHNFEVDRQVGDRLAALAPQIPMISRANRAFLRRAVTYLAEVGITQFLDLGSGIPTAGNVHEILDGLEVDAHVVYVDIDPVAYLHSHAILAGNQTAIAVRGDFTDIGAILADPEVTAHLDFSRPVAVLLVAALHFVPDTADPAATIATLREALPSGSYLAVSHASNELEPDKIEQSTAMYRQSLTALTLRSRTEIAALFDGFDLVDPGLVYLPLWRPDSPDDVDEHPERFNIYAAIGRQR